jgi:ribosome recycling factor
MNRLTPEERKRLAKAVKRLTPEQRRQLVAVVKRQLAKKGTASQLTKRAR